MWQSLWRTSRCQRRTLSVRALPDYSRLWGPSSLANFPAPSIELYPQDSYTDGGTHAGGIRLPPVLTPPNAMAGGRLTNGPVWVENLATDIGAVLKDYAVSFGLSL